MGHNEAGAASHEGFKGALDVLLRAGVNGGGSLVQNQHGGQAQHDAGDAQQLLFALRQAAAILGDDRIIALGQAADEAVGMGGFGGSDDLFIGGIGLAHGDVLPDGAAFQPGFLQHHAVALPQAVAGDIHDVVAVQRDPAVVHIIEAHQQVDQRGFAAASGANDGHPLAGFHVQAQVLDQFALGYIGEAHIAQLHGTGGLLQLQLGLSVRGFRRLIHQRKDPFSAGQSSLQLGHHAGNLVEGLGVLVGIAQERGQLAHRQHAGSAEDAHQRTSNANTGIHQRVNKAGGRVGEGGEENGPKAGLLQPSVDLVKAILHFILHTEVANHFLAGEHLIDEGGLLAAGFGLQGEHVIGALGDETGHHQRKGRDHHHGGGDHPVDGIHEAQCAKNGQNAAEQLGKAHQKAVGELIHIGDHPADHIAGGVGIQIGQGQMLHVLESIPADIPHGGVGQPVIAQAHQPLGQRREADHQSHLQEQRQDALKLHLHGSGNQVDDLTGHNGNVQRSGHGQHTQHQGKHQIAPVALHIAKYPREGLFAIGGFHQTASFGY